MQSRDEQASIRFIFLRILRTKTDLSFVALYQLKKTLEPPSLSALLFLYSKKCWHQCSAIMVLRRYYDISFRQGNRKFPRSAWNSYMHLTPKKSNKYISFVLLWLIEVSCLGISLLFHSEGKFLGLIRPKGLQVRRNMHQNTYEEQIEGPIIKNRKFNQNPNASMGDHFDFLPWWSNLKTS